MGATQTGMSGIPYHLLVQRALRDVVIKEALAIAASEDLSLIHI